MRPERPAWPRSGNRFDPVRPLAEPPRKCRPGKQQQAPARRVKRDGMTIREHAADDRRRFFGDVRVNQKERRVDLLAGMCQTARSPAIASSTNGAGAVCASTIAATPISRTIHMRLSAHRLILAHATAENTGASAAVIRLRRS
jgi:hypothetical protein